MKHNKDTQPNQCDTKPGDPDETFLETDPQPSPKGGRRECPFDPRSLPLALAHVTAACKSLEEGGGTRVQTCNQTRCWGERTQKHWQASLMPTSAVVKSRSRPRSCLQQTHDESLAGGGTHPHHGTRATAEWKAASVRHRCKASWSNGVHGVVGGDEETPGPP